MSTLLLYNPAAAGVRKFLPHARSLLAAKGISFREAQTEFSGDATLKTRSALANGASLILALGGDGTISEAVSGFFRPLQMGVPPSPINPRAALAVLPAGTGNDFARMLGGGKTPSLEERISQVASHLRAPDASVTSRPIDLVRCNLGSQQFLFMNAATLGLGAAGAQAVGEQPALIRALPGRLRYVIAALTALKRWQEHKIEFRVDEGEWIRIRTNILTVSNGEFSGGGMRFSPGSNLSDGLLEVVAANGLSRLGIIRELGRVHKGTHLQNPAVQIYQGKRVQIQPAGNAQSQTGLSAGTARSLALEADGELKGRIPADFEVMPGTLRIV